MEYCTEIVETTDGAFDLVSYGDILLTFPSINAAMQSLREQGYFGPVCMVSGADRFSLVA